MRALVLLSGGIDSPVAAYLMGSRGADVHLLHFDNRPFSDRDFIERIVSLGKVLSSVIGRRIPLHVVPHGENQAAIGRTCERRYQCVLCRRMMLRTAGALGMEMGCDILVTGDSMGQVASQTLENLRTETAVSTLPVVRPLVAMDKEEIIAIARRIGTFELSTLPGNCCMMAPERPSTMSHADRVREEEDHLDLDALVSAALAGREDHVLDPEPM